MRCGRTRGLFALAGLLVVLPAPVILAETPVWLGISAPSEGARLERGIPFIEVEGWAGARQGARHDVLFVLDVSHSTLAPSGSDIDRDGRVGLQGCLMEWWREGGLEWPDDERACPQAGDTIRAAQVAAAQRMLDRLDRRRARVGLVTFHGGAKLVAPLGIPHARLRIALHDIDLQPRSPALGTDFRDALMTALAAFSRAPRRTDWDGAIERSVLFLSDGEPTLPGFGGTPRREALVAAERAALAGLRIHAFALGVEARAHADFYREMAHKTGGTLTHVSDPADVVAWLPLVNLADVTEISMANVTSGEEGRAIRTFPDGSFDGYVPLLRGANRLRVTARGSRGQEVSMERTVHFEPPAFRSARDREKLAEEEERFARVLEERTEETRALRAIERARQRKQLEVRVDDEQLKHLELHVEKSADSPQ